MLPRSGRGEAPSAETDSFAIINVNTNHLTVELGDLEGTVGSGAAKADVGR